MKKLFAIVLCLLMVFALAACEMDEPATSSTPTNALTDVPTNSPIGQPTEPHVHAFGEWVTVKEPTCAEEGQKEATCSCGEKKSEAIALTEHSLNGPTCTEAENCVNCGYEANPALGHSYVDGVCVNCGEPDPDYPQTVHLAMSYERAVTGYNVLGEMIYGYRLDFVYDLDYRGGTVTLTAQERETRHGTFTCDEKYVINHVEFNDAAGILEINAVFDEQYRTRLIEMKSVVDGVETLEYCIENDYDERGIIIRQRYCTPASGDSIQTYVYDDAGKLQSATVTAISGAVTTTLYMTREYDENGYMKADRYADADGNVLMETLYEHEVQGDNVQYTYYSNGMKRVDVYDKNGKIVSNGYYTDENNYQVWNSTYDEKGRLIWREFTMAVDGTTGTSYEERTYLEDGRLQQSKEMYEDQEAIVEKTTYQEVEIPG